MLEALAVEFDSHLYFYKRRYPDHPGDGCHYHGITLHPEVVPSHVSIHEWASATFQEFHDSMNEADVGEDRYWTRYQHPSGGWETLAWGYRGLDKDQPMR